MNSTQFTNFKIYQSTLYCVLVTKSRNGVIKYAPLHLHFDKFLTNHMHYALLVQFLHSSRSKFLCTISDIKKTVEHYFRYKNCRALFEWTIDKNEGL